MQSWGRSREVEKAKQVSVASLPEDQQEAAMDDCDRAVEQYPSVLIADDDCALHIFETRGEWQAWLNNEDHDFTGLCVSVGRSRQQAVTDAVRILEAAVEELQRPPR